MEIIFSKFAITSLWLKIIITFVIGVFLGLVLQQLVFYFIKVYNKKKPTVFKEQLLKYLKTPTKFLLPILFVYSSIYSLELSSFWHKVIEALIIINFSWALLAFINALEEIVKQKFTSNNSHKAKDRKIITQLRFIKSISMVIVIILAIAAILWNIPKVRTLGTTILTSAGIIGVIAGVAAQKSIANLITGLQIAFTQPIKIDDEVEIEGEFGIVEDITLTYVVVKTWDWRRLVLPLNYFNETPFVNWTFNSAQIIGSIYLYVDYTFPVKELRQKFLQIINDNALWDKQIAELLVTKTDASSVEVRVSFSAKNATDVWDMRCDIREQLIEFIQKKYPNSLPKIRRERLLN